jgi:DNA-binding transcriptional LysR family regulator
MDVRQIETYQAVMTYGTASRAAEMLGMSQPAVSKAIMTLERSIGFRLFDRDKGRMTPTAEGVFFHREVQSSLVAIAKLRSAAARIRDYGSGDIQVGCLSAFSTNLVPSAIAKFRKRHPEVAVSLTVAASSSIRDMIAANQLDIAITADEVDTTGVESVPFAQVPAALAIPPGHRLALKDVVVPMDLDRIDFVALAPEDTTRHEAEAIFARYGVAPKVVVETAYASVVCALVLAGTGCGIVDPVTATDYVQRGLVLRPLDPCPNFRTLMLFPPRKTSRIVADMAKALTSEAEKATKPR